ncbi:G-type lectin S-receptor-like serine/threonine-protein kinase LECRK1 [Impatiens glandulifera]|uniref:G-type lectin S-receptor-like serine/threonine-protein kinase LECRK1 n=1 Tax=Impatiens glandulifera TaxID=253017 RepID=UPI001FB152F4|nr:G-type lectin S-receptor-like serine/threonine-protein kinase LECRK1 [Impatiens glandulifera]
MVIPGFLTTILLLSSFSSSSAQLNRQNITLGSFLTPTSTRNSTWLSPSGLYAFGFYKQGNGFYVGIFLAGIPEKTVVWTANRDNPPLSNKVTLLYATNGRLILQQPSGETTPLIMDTSSSSSASALMLDSGNFVLYNSNGEPIWQSFENPTDTILATQNLSNNKELVSAESTTNPASGSFRLKMQTDGNLVQYPVQTPDTPPYSYFSSFTHGKGASVTLNLEKNGHLYLFNSTIILRNYSQGSEDDHDQIYLMRIDPDGIFRVYSHVSNWSVVWSSNTDLCTPKGRCGLNGYCELIDDQADCRCLPGFDFVKAGDWSSGCERDFNVERCKSEKDVSTMSSLANTTWEENSNWVMSQITQQACEQVCLDDCDCQVALYNDGVCRKQRLPLRYGRRQMGDSNMALVKTQTRTGHGNTEIVPPKQETGSSRVVMLSIGLSLFVLVCIFLIASCFLFYRSWLSGYRKLPAYMNNRSLDYILSLHEKRPSWDVRIRIVLDIVKGILDLYEECENDQVIHGDISPKIIMMEEYRVIKIRDFGMANVLKHDKTKTCLTVGATRGYMDPERFMTSMPTVKSDVYSFGIVLLEIITWRRWLNWSLPKEEVVLVKWVWSCFELGELQKLVGDVDFDMKMLEKMVKVAIWCIQEEPSLRPTMKEVLLMLEGTVDIPVPSSPTSLCRNI